MGKRLCSVPPPTQSAHSELEGAGVITANYILDCRTGNQENGGSSVYPEL